MPVRSLPLVFLFAVVCAAAPTLTGCTTSNPNATHDGGPVDGSHPGDGHAGDAGACDPACIGDTPYCDTASARCVACRDDNDCGKGTLCGTRSGEPACVQGCKSDADCVARGGNETSCCDRSCVDLQGDALHCGTCGAACPVPAHGRASCESGACGLDSCEPGYKDCNQQVADGCEAYTDGDPLNCGACGLACPTTGHATATCEAGVCGVGSCASGYADCDGNAQNGCESLLATDVNHCGTCATACPLPAHATATCAQGTCGLGACYVGWGDCDHDATNGCEAGLNLDVNNCGSCGNACAPVAHGSPSCTGGACRIASCDTGWANCDGLYANGCETSVTSDAGNCGACGKLCGAVANGTGACMNGACAIASCSAGYADCDGNYANGCEVNLRTDKGNCGRCANACPAAAHQAATCTAGMCAAACAAGWADCDGDAANGCEASLQTDPTHCGTCATACSLAHATPGCNTGACVIGACDTGWGNCDGVNFNGCEKTVIDDVNNCGGCGKACSAVAHATVGCTGTTCILATCTGNYADCDGQYANGCEVNRDNDLNNCGACGKVCPVPPHAAATCTGASCGMGACTAGWANCDGNAANGCEQDISGSLTNCGSCGKACADVANGSPACTAGTCTIAACDAGFADCNRNYGDGCEADLLADKNNCGTCGKACTYANGTGACVTGGCALTGCNTGYASCDGSDANGCEVNLQTDKANCGGCGNACPSGQSCVGGTCQLVKEVTYSQSFTLGATPSTQCTAWDQFRAQLTDTYTSITVSGSLYPTGYTCTGAAANTLCQALRTGTVATVSCGGRTWYVGTGCGPTAAVELALDYGVCSCSTQNTLRPCIANNNWGGLGGTTCNATSQTLTVVCKQ